MAADALTERFVEAKGGLVEVVDAEYDLGEAADTGTALGFCHETSNSAAALRVLGDDEFRNPSVASRTQRRDTGHFKLLKILRSHQPDDNATPFSHEERLVGWRVESGAGARGRGEHQLRGISSRQPDIRLNWLDVADRALDLQHTQTESCSSTRNTP